MPCLGRVLNKKIMDGIDYFKDGIELGVDLTTLLASNFLNGNTTGENNLCEWQDNDEGYGGTTSYTKFLPNNEIMHGGDSDGFDSTPAFVNYWVLRRPKNKPINKAKTISFAGVGGSKGPMEWVLYNNILYRDNELGSYVKATYHWEFSNNRDLSEMTPTIGKDSLLNLKITFEKITDKEYFDFHGLGSQFHGVCIYGQILKGLNYKLIPSQMVEFTRRRYTHSKFTPIIEDEEGNRKKCTSLVYPNKDYKPLTSLEDMTLLYNMHELHDLMIEDWKTEEPKITKKEIKSRISRLTPTNYKEYKNKEYLNHSTFKIKTEGKEYWFDLSAVIVGRSSETAEQDLFKSEHNGNLHPWAYQDAKKAQIPQVELLSPNKIYFSEISIISNMWESRIDFMKFVCKFHPLSPNLPYSADKSKNADKRFEKELRSLIQKAPIWNGFIYESDTKLSKKEELNKVQYLIDVKNDSTSKWNLILLDNLSQLTGESMEDLREAEFGGETSGIHMFDLDNPITLNDKMLSNLEYQISQMDDAHLGEFTVRLNMPSATMSSAGWIHGGHSTQNYDKLNRLLNKTDNPHMNEAYKKKGLKRVFTIEEKYLYKQDGWKEAKIINL